MFIKKAAILYKQIGIIEGTSYQGIRNVAYKMGVTGSSIYGYTDSSDNFIGAVEAAKIAIKSGQLDKDFEGSMSPEDLFGNNELENAID